MAGMLHLLQRQLSQHPLTDVGGKGQLSDGFAMSGRPGRPRGWHAHLRANPAVTVHLKQSMQVDVTAKAIPTTSEVERRTLITEIARRS